MPEKWFLLPRNIIHIFGFHSESWDTHGFFGCQPYFNSVSNAGVYIVGHSDLYFWRVSELIEDGLLLGNIPLGKATHISSLLGYICL